MADERATSLDEMNAYLRTELPLTQAMGIRVKSWDGRTVELAAPLGPNLNHADTAFGGSIAALGILAGYTLLYLTLRDRGVSNKLLIQRSEVDFLRPIDTDLGARATLPAEEEVAAFLEGIARRRRGRLSVVSEILSGVAIGARHTGVYIAIKY
jgi:thioesterase domain-containing protein